MNSKQLPESGKAGEALRVFARLGCAAFGGPIAHPGFFRQEFVEQRFVIAGLPFIGRLSSKLPPWLIVLMCAIAGKLFLQ